MMVHVLESWADLSNIRHLDLDQQDKDREPVWLCSATSWAGSAPLPYPCTDPEFVAIRLLATATVAGLFAHRWPGVGRMLGCSSPPAAACCGQSLRTGEYI